MTYIGVELRIALDDISVSEDHRGPKQVVNDHPVLPAEKADTAPKCKPTDQSPIPHAYLSH